MLLRAVYKYIRLCIKKCVSMQIFNYNSTSSGNKLQIYLTLYYISAISKVSTKNFIKTKLNLQFLCSPNKPYHCTNSLSLLQITAATALQGQNHKILTTSIDTNINENAVNPYKNRKRK